jgi:hypothetical protein
MGRYALVLSANLPLAVLCAPSETHAAVETSGQEGLTGAAASKRRSSVLKSLPGCCWWCTRPGLVAQLQRQVAASAYGLSAAA